MDWGHLTAIVDCHDREVTGFEFALRGRAKEAERALEEACLARFGTLRPDSMTPVVRSDNGLIFQSRRFRAYRDYRLRQEFITPYTPEQNGGAGVAAYRAFRHELKRKGKRRLFASPSARNRRSCDLVSRPKRDSCVALSRRRFR